MCASHLVDENLETAKALIREAASHGAKLIVLPEMFAIMGLKVTDKIKIREVQGQGSIQSFLSEQARLNHVWIVGGTIPLACGQPQKVSAASLVYDDQGRLAARYDK